MRGRIRAGWGRGYPERYPASRCLANPDLVANCHGPNTLVWTARSMPSTACPKSKESESLADRLHQCTVPVLLLAGTVSHPAEVNRGQRELLRKRLPRFKAD